MKSVVIFNTAVSSENLGDQIIMESVNREINSVIDKNTFLLDLSTHAGFNRKYNNFLKKSDFSIIGGTNILSSQFNLVSWRNQFCVGYWNSKYMHDVILIGTGWGSKNKEVKPNAKKFYKKILSKEAVHSVRDSMSLKKLTDIGIKNVVNTGCPTLWQLTPEKCQKIPRNKSSKVVTTITDYLMDYEKDFLMLRTLISEYEEVFLWVQGSEDYKYFCSLPLEITQKISLIPPRLSSYDEFLNNNEVDFIGTRLHAGIRAMQKNKRTLIISIDNRAREMGKDFNLNILEREHMSELKNIINSSLETSVELAKNEIEKWRNQFKP